MSLNQNITKRNEKLAEKMKEIDDAWCDIGTFMPSYLKKLKHVISAMQDEADSITFFQKYPKVFGHLDKVLNLLVVLQCEFDILTCDEVLNLRTVAKCDTSVVSNKSLVIKKTQDAGAPPTSKIADIAGIISQPQTVIDELREKYDVQNNLPKENLIPDATDGKSEETTLPDTVLKENDSSVSPTSSPTDKENHITTIDHTEIEVVTLPDNVDKNDTSVSDLSCVSDNNADTSKTVLSSKNIAQYVITPNEVLEMVYSHGDNPWNFWLCHYPYSDLEFIQTSIKRLYNTNSLESLTDLPRVGDNVVVADGKCFIRGKILSVKRLEVIEKMSVMVLDVDSGRMKSFRLASLCRMPQNVISIPAQAVNCQLQGILGDSSIWCKENLEKCKMLHKFESLVQQTTLSVKFIRTLSGSSLTRYIIDADCVNLETDQILNVTEVVNNMIIPALIGEPSKYCLQITSSVQQDMNSTTKLGVSSESCDNVFVEDPVLQSNKAHVTGANLTFEIPHELQCEPDISFAGKENSELKGPFSKITHEKQEGESNSQPNSDNCLTVDLISNDKSTEMLNVTNPYRLCPDGKLLSDTLCTYTVSCPEVVLEEKFASGKVSDTDNVKQQKDYTGIELLSAHFAEHLQEVYCDKNVVLQKRDYRFLSNQTILGIATYVDSPNIFYMQFFLEQDNAFIELHEGMNNFYSENKIIFPSVASARNCIGPYCAAMYPEDGKWYRAQISEWFTENESSVYVKFVDIGDSIVLTLDLIQPLAKKFAKYPILAQKCHLYGLVPFECEMYGYTSYDWPSYALSEFRSLLHVNSHYNIQLLEFTKDDSIGVVLVDPDRSDASTIQRLIAMGQAKYLPSEDKLSVWDPMKVEYERYLNMAYNDEDACVAVTGYSPNDEKRICKFYARDGRCFKGAKCRKEHVLSHPGGWTSDKNSVFQDAFSQIVLPEVGETVYLQVTCVIRINLFYVILNLENNADEETLLTLNKYINDKENLKAMRLLEVTPAVGQLVLAHYSSDGIWYRARVVDTDNDNNLVQVFFVDYGNTEWVSETDVRDIEPQYLHLPFQAIESSLAFAEMNSSVDDDGLGTIISLFRSITTSCQLMKAKIISKDNALNKLELQLYDESGHDIALSLAETGYVRISRILMTPASGFPMPG